MTGKDCEPQEPSLDCKFCGVTFSSKYDLHDHILTASHLDNVRDAIEKNKYEPPTPGILDPSLSSSSDSNNHDTSVPRSRSSGQEDSINQYPPVSQIQSGTSRTKDSSSSSSYQHSQYRSSFNNGTSSVYPDYRSSGAHHGGQSPQTSYQNTSYSDQYNHSPQYSQYQHPYQSDYHRYALIY